VTRDGFKAGDRTVLPSRNLLVRGDVQVRLEPRVMDVLVRLAEHAEQPVSKEELLEDVWNGRFVSDDAPSVANFGSAQSPG
jgi:DNA-binding winged helix-turn-helix (wHTH) protein